MTIISVGKMWSRDEGTTTSDGRKIEQTIKQGWQIVTSPDATVEEVTFAIGLPQVDDALVGTNWIFCTSVRPKRVGPIFWTADVEYRGEIGPGGVADTPVNQPPVIKWRAVLNNEAIDSDDWGMPITNSNGDPVDGITDDIADMTLYVQRNYIDWNPYLTRLYMRSVNSDYFPFGVNAWPPGTAKLREFEADQVFGALSYWRITAMVQFREPFNTTAARTWWKRYHNKGLRVRGRTNVTFSKEPAATCHRATGYAVVDDAGTVTAIAITDRGHGYTTAPSVTITSSDGSGASATAINHADGYVDSVTINSGGSDYKSGMFRAVDDRKEPVTEPVFLNYDGTELKNSYLATWIERPVGVTPLPYNALGLL